MTQTFEKRILQIISQTYAFSYDELEKLFLEVNSFDRVLDSVNISRKHNISLERAFETWKETK